MAEISFLSKEDQKQILAAIAEAENRTSGEIRLRVENHCSGDPLQRAIKVFELLRMHRTKDRNGILLYVSFDDRKIAIYGDEGIHRRVPENYWQSTLDQMRIDFAKGQYASGLVRAIKDVGTKLKQFFPYQTDDVNELKDDISHGDLEE